MPKKPATKPKPKKTAVAAVEPRRLVLPKRIWYKPLTWRHRPPVPVYKPLSKARIIFAHTLKLVWANKKLFGGIALIYGALNVLLVRGFSSGRDVLQLKEQLDVLLGGVSGRLASSVVTFVGLLGSSGAGGTATAGLYQSVLLVLGSLAVIWALRQVLAKHRVRVRDAFYQGMYPVVPFVLVFLLMGVQLLPLTAGGALYSASVSYGIALHPVEKIAAFTVFIALALWSLRMITASLFALYIVTLPNMTPWAAYKSARQLVYGRRLLIWRKLIFLPVVLLLVAVAIELPLILFVAPLAVWVFFALTMVALPVAHGYLYNLYREML